MKRPTGARERRGKWPTVALRGCFRAFRALPVRVQRRVSHPVPAPDADLARRPPGREIGDMMGFIYFDIHDRVRLPRRFFGECLRVTARG